MDVCAVCEFWSKVRPRTCGCVAMGSPYQVIVNVETGLF